MPGIQMETSHMRNKEFCDSKKCLDAQYKIIKYMLIHLTQKGQKAISTLIMEQNRMWRLYLQSSGNIVIFV